MMATSHPTYAYQDDKIIAFDGNQVIASGTDFTKVAETADEYFNALRKQKEHTARAEAKYVITPNGERGTILSRTASLWTDEITVRFDNGQIRHYDTFAADSLKFSSTEDAPKNPLDYFQARLDEAVDPTRQGLVARVAELNDIRESAARLITAGVTTADATKLHQIVLTAETEKREVAEALEHLASVDEAIEFPKQQYTAYEQASLGRSANDDWLEVVAKEMEAENEAQDFDKLAAEGPTVFVGALDDAVVAHAGVTRELAEGYIHGKTAAFQGEEVANFRDQFVANVEIARQREASYRTQVAKTAAVEKEASISDAPDEALFL
jgi:hypothetical protein